MGTGTGAGTETRAVAEMGTGTVMGKGTEKKPGSGRTEKSTKHRIRIVDAIRHFYSARVIISADRG